MDSFISQVPKRISKLESFLRQNEEKIGSRSLRYYESCVVDYKGTLILGHLVLTDEALFLTQNPPKSFSHAILLSQIANIHLVADRKSLVTGPGNNNYYAGQHIEVLYSSLKTPKPEPKETKDSKRKSKSPDSEFEDHGSTASSTHSNEELSLTSNCFCLQNHVEIPLSIRTAYHPHSCRPAASSLFSRYSSDRSTGSDGSDSFFLSGSRSSQEKFERHTPTSYNENGITTSASISTISSITDERKSQPLTSTPTPAPAPTALRSTSVLEHKLFSWISRKENGLKADANANPVKRPSSFDMSQLSKFRKYKWRFGSSFKKKSLNKNEGSGKEVEEKSQQAKEPLALIEIVNIYLYDPTSSFLNEVFLYWHRQVLKSTIVKEIRVGEGNAEPERRLHAAEKEFARLGLNQDVEMGIWIYPKPKELQRTSNAPWQLNRLLTRLNSLYKSLNTYHHLSRLCWKSPVVVRSLVGILKSCLVPIRLEQEKENNRNIEHVDGSDRILVLQLSIYLLVMDIFRLLFESCSSTTSMHEEATEPGPRQHEGQRNGNGIKTSGNSPYNSNNNDEKVVEWAQITRTLLSLIFSFPNPTSMTNKRKLISNKILKVNLIPQNFAKLEWSHGRNMEVTELLVMGHNASVALLYEILSVVHYSQTGSVSKLLENYNMEMYLRMSVTQIIHLLWPSPSPGHMSSSQAALLYVHLAVLKTLNTQPHVKKFLQLSFSEEFQYFISRRSADKKVHERYLLKEKLLAICDELRQGIMEMR